MHVVHDDGGEQEIGPSQAYVIERGHDAWVVGDDPVVGLSSSRGPLRSTREAEVDSGGNAVPTPRGPRSDPNSHAVLVRFRSFELPPS